MTTRTLLKGGCVLTLDRTVGNLLRGDVLIEDERIAGIGEDLRSRDAHVIDATNTIVMPGFVDTHRHTARSLFRNLGTGSDATALSEHFMPEDVYAGTLIGLLGAIEAGITTVVDWADIQVGDEYLEAALQAHSDAELRSVFVHTMTRGTATDDDAARSIQRRLLADAQAAAGALTTVALGSGDLTRANFSRTMSEWQLARELGLPIHVHAGLETSDGGVVAEAAEQGLLDSDVTLVHCTRLNDVDLDAVASSGARVSLTPSTEMAGNLGQPPIQQLLDREIRLSLGVDDEQLAPGDLFAQIRSTISLQHATYFDLKLAGKAGLPNLLTTRDMIQYATLDGARSAGLDGETGSLRPGKQADIIVLRTDRPNIFPVNDPIGAVIWGMDTSNLDWVFAAGRPLMREGVLDADLDHARTLAAEAQARVAASGGQATALAVGEQP